MIPAGKNWVANPSAEVDLTNIGAAASSVNTRDQTNVWAGSWAVKVVPSSGTAFSGVYYNASLTGLTLTGVTHSVTGAVRIWAAAAVVVPDIRLRIGYTDATFTDTAVTLNTFIGNGAWQTVYFQEIFSNPAKTISYIRVMVSTWNNTPYPGGLQWWTDGADIRIDEPADGDGGESYIDGSLGTLYSWTGTAHNSASLRATEAEYGPVGQGGTITSLTTAYLSDKDNTTGDWVTESVLGGAVEMDIDRDTVKTTLRLATDDPSLIQEFAWIKLISTLEYEDGTQVKEQVGLFRLEHPATAYDGESVVCEYGGFDVTILLADATFTGNYKINSGANLVAAAKTLIQSVGLTRIDIPASSKTATSTGMSWKAGDSKLKAVNDIMAAVGYYSVYADRSGRVKSIPVIENLKGEQPAFSYTVGVNSEIVGTLSFDPNDDNIFNQVTVIRDDPAKGTPLTKTVFFDDPRSRVSTVNLGVKSKTYWAQEAADQATIDSLAAKYLQDRTMYVTGTLEVLPQASHDIHEVIDLDLAEMAHVPTATDRNGRYYVKAYSYDLSPATMRLTVRRIERFD